MRGGPSLLCFLFVFFVFILLWDYSSWLFLVMLYLANFEQKSGRSIEENDSRVALF